MKRRGTAVERVFIKDDMLNCRFGSEAELRSGIARVADAYGWIVEEEVVVPGWGRIDLVLRASPRNLPLLVELKLDLLKASDVRKAYQQADGYSRWWAKENSEANTPVLVSNKADMTLISSIGDAYPTVKYRGAFSTLKGLRTWEVTPFRQACAQRRLEERRRQFEINDHAVDCMAEDRQEREAAECLAALEAEALKADADGSVDS